jgi:ribonuclease HI
MSENDASVASFQIHVDGASRGNPGEAGFGVSIVAADRTVTELYGYLGQTTNNVAEYQALIHGLHYAAEQNAKRVEVFSDSELIVKQLRGAYRVRQPHLVPLYRCAQKLLARFEGASVEHVRREHNKDADRLANRAVDERKSNWPAELRPPQAWPSIL